MEDDKKTMKELKKMSHLFPRSFRRAIRELAYVGRSRASDMLSLVGEIYGVERDVVERSVKEARRNLTSSRRAKESCGVCKNRSAKAKSQKPRRRHRSRAVTSEDQKVPSQQVQVDKNEEMDEEDYEYRS